MKRRSERATREEIARKKLNDFDEWASEYRNKLWSIWWGLKEKEKSGNEDKV